MVYVYIYERYRIGGISYGFVMVRISVHYSRSCKDGNGSRYIKKDKTAHKMIRNLMNVVNGSSKGKV